MRPPSVAALKAIFRPPDQQLTCNGRIFAPSVANHALLTSRAPSVISFGMATKAIDRGEVLPSIYAAVAAGSSLDKVLKTDGMPAPTTFWRWHMEDEEVRDNLARARECGVERYLDEIVDIADDKSEDPASRRVRIEARVKAAQMIAPRKYGPKVDVTSDGKALPAPTVLHIDAKIQAIMLTAAGRREALLEAESSELEDGEQAGNETNQGERGG